MATRSIVRIIPSKATEQKDCSNVAEVGTLSATKTNNLASVDFKAKKYGESSYLIQLEDLEPGEYGIIIGDPNNANTKNGMKVTTFTVE